VDRIESKRSDTIKKRTDGKTPLHLAASVGQQPKRGSHRNKKGDPQEAEYLQNKSIHAIQKLLNSGAEITGHWSYEEARNLVLAGVDNLLMKFTSLGEV